MANSSPTASATSRDQDLSTRSRKPHLEIAREQARHLVRSPAFRSKISASSAIRFGFQGQGVPPSGSTTLESLRQLSRLTGTPVLPRLSESEPSVHNNVVEEDFDRSAWPPALRAKRQYVDADGGRDQSPGLGSQVQLPIRHPSWEAPPASLRQLSRRIQTQVLPRLSESERTPQADENVEAYRSAQGTGFNLPQREFPVEAEVNRLRDAHSGDGQTRPARSGHMITESMRQLGRRLGARVLPGVMK
jgi:hypothetical protein